MNYENLFLNITGSDIDYTTRLSSPQQRRIPVRDYYEHGERLKSRYNEIMNSKEDESLLYLKDGDGYYIEFFGKDGHELVIKSLEDLSSKKIRLLNVKYDENEDGKEITSALVYATSDKVESFLDKINDYLNDEKLTGKGRRKNQDLINSIEDFRVAVFEDFWQGNEDLIPSSDDRKWVEIWIRTDKNKEITNHRLDLFDNVVKELNLESSNSLLLFAERAVKIVKANKKELESFIRKYSYVAEIHSVSTLNSAFMKMNLSEQKDWVKDLKKRTVINKNGVDERKVCIIDTGINNQHPLLVDIVSDDDLFVVNDAFENIDLNGHGTQMSGVVIYGDLKRVLESDKKYKVLYGVEALKILPDSGNNDPELYGSITEQGINIVESTAPSTNRVYCMAVTAEQESDGTPTSWSAAIDKLTFGDELEDYQNKRLVIISAGNINTMDEGYNYFDTNLLKSIQDPAQSWNSITVGAFTNLYNNEKSFAAPLGGLCPSSSTSYLWKKGMPIKPEVVFEGGNYIVETDGIYSDYNMQYLTLSNRIEKDMFSSLGDTSLATALAAKFVQGIALKYPNAWPETIRALMIHSSQWNETMFRQLKLSPSNMKKGDYGKLLRVFGYGSPLPERAIYSQENKVNLIIEDTIQPYIKEQSRVKTNSMKFYKLPWPKSLLEEMAEKEVRVKITLSYFIEPGPGNLGKLGRYRYPSSLLRFDMKNEFESDIQFQARISSAVQTDDVSIEGSSKRWLYGKNNRDVGSIHCDVWVGSAVDLAQADCVAVYPQMGWWKERTNQEKYNNLTRFSLVISIETEEDINIYNEVKNIIEIESQTSTSLDIKIKV